MPPPKIYGVVGTRPRQGPGSRGALSWWGHDSWNFYLIMASTGVGVVVRRGMDPPSMTGGGARWATVERPRRTTMTQWVGTDPYKMSLPILFDGHMLDKIMETEISVLNRMRFPEGEGDIPPTIKITGQVPVKNARWIIESIDWGDNVYWKPKGRTRQDATINLLQYIEAERLEINSQKGKGKAKPRKLKKGETLDSIAVEKYGSVKYRKLIMTANGIRDPKTVKAGDEIVLPAKPKGSSK